MIASLLTRAAVAADPGTLLPTLSTYAQPVIVATADPALADAFRSLDADHDEVTLEVVLLAPSASVRTTLEEALARSEAECALEVGENAIGWGTTPYGDCRAVRGPALVTAPLGPAPTDEPSKPPACPEPKRPPRAATRDFRDDIEETNFYEARVFTGSNAPPMTAAAMRAAEPGTVGTPLVGLGIRFGGGPVVAAVSGYWSDTPDFDIRVQYAGYAHRVRVAAGLVVSRDGYRGPAEWLAGMGLDLDLDLSRANPDRRNVWEVFLSASMEDRPSSPWESGHMNTTVADGIRWLRGPVGVELGVAYRSAYEDGSSTTITLALIGRMHIDVASSTAEPPIPLVDLQVLRAP